MDKMMIGYTILLIEDKINEVENDKMLREEEPEYLLKLLELKTYWEHQLRI